jgi:hypothetical protein
MVWVTTRSPEYTVLVVTAPSPGRMMVVYFADQLGRVPGFVFHQKNDAA